MMGRSFSSPILRIELWHGSFLLALAALAVPLRLLDPWALMLGGLFMGVNFLLLGYGIRWLLGALAARGRVRAGIFLLVLKFMLFLGALSALMLQVPLDARSFAVGISCLLAAIVVEAARACPGERE